MPSAGDVAKRVLLGRALRSDKLGETLLPKKIALPVFASDALSSVAYAPDEIFLTLSIAGLAAYSFSWKVGLVVVAVMLVVVASLPAERARLPVRRRRLRGRRPRTSGRQFGLTVAAALLVDYVLTVAVSVSSGVQNAASALSGSSKGHEAPSPSGSSLLLTAINLRGVKESGAAFAIPTYGFMIAIVGMTAFGLFRHFFGDLPDVESAQYTIAPEHSLRGGLHGTRRRLPAAADLLLRAAPR